MGMMAKQLDAVANSREITTLGLVAIAGARASSRSAASVVIGTYTGAQLRIAVVGDLERAMAAADGSHSTKSQQ